ncbi:MAG: heavy metal translocating P-type ATPase [Roseburia inulinivorans]|uniref:Cd(2+)-exporting ATPase n=1 Tax=Roseburia inulinivorans TaxID=360807 RepID=A0A396ALH5_9FIRM|nr:heavy metal translocating P-type ATPase [Roseburia inulinivorans]RHD05494.1 cadmium-translocating P-type ATPase [Roseburia inulinivorans]
MTKKQKKMLYRIIVTFLLFAVLMVCEHTGRMDGWNKIVLFVIYLVPYLVIGYDIVYKAARNISHGQVFDENFLMMIATFGAFGVGEYSEAVAVMLFYQVGELFQGYAVGKSRQSISDMMDICPEYANIEEDGVLKQVDPDDVEVGSIIVVKPGERIPLDGIVVEGESLIDTAALTGESVPRSAKAGDEIISGCVNGSGTLKVKTTKEFDDSTVAKILELVENASSKKAKVENFITRFAKYYTPVVTIGAVILAILPPLIIGGGWAEWIQRACIFLVISCPCALVISVPLGFFGGIGAASKIGVLVKGSNYLEAVAEMTTIVFDKTGTLTKGEFKVTDVITENGSKEELIELAALGEGYSNHPIANSIREAYGKELDLNRVTNTEEIAGHGIKAVIDGKTVLLGNEKLMKSESIFYTSCKSMGTVVYVACNGVFEGAVVISDTIKDGAKEAIRDMKQVGVRHTVMLTGDRREAAETVAQTLGIDEVHAELLPGGKVEQVEALLKAEKEKERLAFVGDGINDAPVLTRADIGIAMGSMGSDAAIEAADIVLMDDDVTKIASVVKIARKTLRIVKQNIVFALAIKALVLILGALGMANMWEAVFADVGVSVIAILNSMRTLNEK